MSTNRRKVGTKAKKRWKKSITRLVNGLSRRIVVYLSDRQAECPNCYYDKVNRTSSGVAKSNPGDDNYFAVGRCPVCFGKGVLTTSRKRCINGIVVWDPSEDSINSLTFTPAGFEGATKVEVKTDPCNLDVIKQSKYVLIDGISCKLSNPPIIRGIGERNLLVVYFFTTDKPKVNNGENI